MDQADFFAREGYAILPGFFPHAQVDAVLARIDAIKGARPRDVVIDLLDTGERTSLALLERSEVGTRRMKINDLYLAEEVVRELALAERIVPLLRQLLGEAPALCNSLYFDFGSAQPAHVDALYMTPRTPRHLIATWVALEDVHADAGPLEYYPQSHLIEPMRFSHGGYHHVPAEMPGWHAYIEREVAARGLRKESFAARKGDVFIWHANLLHGGGPIRDPQRTRKSLVFHFYSESDCRATGAALEPLAGGYWIRRPPQALPLEAATRLQSRLEFSEADYLARYPDVAAAVKAGAFQSGWMHYDLFGRKEGRLPC